MQVISMQPLGTVVDLWGQYVGYSQHTADRVKLKKILISICYHSIRAFVAIKESLMEHMPSLNNPEDICTKVVPGGVKWKHLIGKVLHYLYYQ